MENRRTQEEHQNIIVTPRTDRDSIPRIVEKAKRGDHEALVLLCQTIVKGVLFSCLRLMSNHMDAEDVAQEVLIRVCERIHTLKNPQAFDAWLNTIVINEIRRYASRNAKRGETYNLDEYLDSSSSKETEEFLPDEYAMQEEDRRMVIEIIDMLPIRQREAIILFYYRNLGVVETAKVMQVSQPTASRYLKLAREKIKNELQKRQLKTGTLQGILLLPIGEIVSRALSQESMSISSFGDSLIRNAMTNINTGVATGTVIKSLIEKILMVGAAKVITPVVAVATLATGIVVGVAQYKEKNQIPQTPQQEVVVSTGYHIVFDGGENNSSQINPNRASAWVETNQGEMTALGWWITSLGSEDILFAGTGKEVTDELLSMKEDGLLGEYILYFRMEDVTGSTYILNRQFTIK